MADEQPASRPAAPEPDKARSPSVYGDQWGKSGKQNEQERGAPDRPSPIETPPEPQGGKP